MLRSLVGSEMCIRDSTISKLQTELLQHQMNAVTAAELVELRDSAASLHTELESTRRENTQLRGLLVARGGGELVDDSGPLSCLSEVIARRDQTIAMLKKELAESKISQSFSMVSGGGWQKVPTIPVSAETFVVEEEPVLSARTWEGMSVALVVDPTEEGLHSLDSLDQWESSSSFRAVSYTHLTLPTKRIV
eukprot:TRINITY_DN36454_c0_g1_i2.p1 TRINITY_DN36454_c0_g1~~TRINITY_DN36454_c0_g1_i2.p1  ORF type:complete len:213 (-),score=71.58 TRINITY_DN36454_c0_g1_i2:63-638(-)